MSTWYGSVQNRIEERMASPEPVVGMGATEMMYTDCRPYEIIAVKDARHCTARAMEHRRPAGYDGDGYGDNTWECISNPCGRVVNLFKTKQGRWVERMPSGSYGSTFRLGEARYYYCYEL